MELNGHTNLLKHRWIPNNHQEQYVVLLPEFLCADQRKTPSPPNGTMHSDLRSISLNLTSIFTDLIILHQAADQHQQKSVSCKAAPSVDLHILPTKDKGETREDKRTFSSWITDQFHCGTKGKIPASSLTVFGKF